MFEGFFGKPKAESKPPVKFDKIDTEANKVANEVRDKADSVERICDIVLTAINKQMTEANGIIFRETTVDDFVEFLAKEQPPFHEDLRYKIDHLIEYFPEEMGYEDTLEAFLKKVEEKREESQRVLHPGEYL